MDHFKGLNNQERYSNELMSHTRRQTELLEQIAQLLQPKGVGKIEPNNRPKHNGSRSSNGK